MSGSNILQSYLIKLGVEADKRSLDGFVGTIHSALAGMAKMGTMAAGAFGLIQGAVIKLASSEASLNDFSDRVGISVGNIERLGYVASQTGSGTQELHASLQSLSEKAGEAAGGMAGAVKIFDDLRISATKANGETKDTAELLEEVGRALEGKDRSQQNAFLKRLGIDRSLIRTLIEDTSGLRAEFDAMSAAAGVDFEKSANAASDLMDELGKTTTFTKLLGKAVGADLMQDLSGGMRWIRQKIRENVAGIQAGVDVVVKITKTGTLLFGGFLSRVTDGFLWLHEKTAGLSTAFLALKTILLFVSAPVIALIAVFGALYLVVDDLWTALEGGKSLINWGPWLGDIRTIGRWLKGIGGTIKEGIIAHLVKAQNLLREYGPVIKDGIVSAMKTAWDWAVKVAGIVKGELVQALEVVKAWMDEVATALDYDSWVQGIPATITLLEDFLKALEDIAGYAAGAAWQTVKTTFRIIGLGISTVINVIKELAALFVNLINGDFTRAARNLEKIFSDLNDFLLKVFDGALSVINTVLETVGKTIDRIKEFLGLSRDPDAPGPKSTVESLEGMSNLYYGTGPTNAWMTPKPKPKNRVKDVLPAGDARSENREEIKDKFGPIVAARRQPNFSFDVPPSLPQGKSMASMNQSNVTNNQGGEVKQTFNTTINTTTGDPKGHAKAFVDTSRVSIANAMRHGTVRFT